MTDLLQSSVGHALVTGAGGFIGSHLTESLLSSDVQVTALDLSLTAVQQLASSARCRLLRGDIEDSAVRTDALSGVDTVFHLAAAHLGALQPAAEFQRVNVTATRSLAEASIQAGVRRFVHCSSVGVYGRLASPPADEETPCHPELPYEQTKLEGEQAILRLVEERQLPAVILRPAWVYGPGCHRTEKLFKTIAAKKFLVAGKGETFRHCIFIDDMVEALELTACQEGSVGEIFIIGDRQPVTVRGLVDQIARLTGAPPPRSIPLPMVAIMASGVEQIFRVVGKEPPVSRRSLRFFTGNTSFLTSKAETGLGFSPRFDINSGLNRTSKQLAIDIGIPRRSRESAER